MTKPKMLFVGTALLLFVSVGLLLSERIADRNIQFAKCQLRGKNVSLCMTSSGYEFSSRADEKCNTNSDLFRSIGPSYFLYVVCWVPTKRFDKWLFDIEMLREQWFEMLQERIANKTK